MYIIKVLVIFFSVLTINSLVYAGVGYSDARSVNLFITGDGLYGIQGTMRRVRNTSNNIEYLECSNTTTKLTSGFSNIAYCRARTSAGRYRSCYTYNPEMIKDIRGIQNFSYIYLTVRNGRCYELRVNHASERLAGNR